MGDGTSHAARGGTPRGDRRIDSAVFGEQRLKDFNYNSGYASVNGAKIYYEIAGAGYPLILLHAGIADSRMWDAQFPDFAQDNLVIRFDMRGFGRTKLVRGEFSPVEDVAGLMDT